MQVTQLHHAQGIANANGINISNGGQQISSGLSGALGNVGALIVSSGLNQNNNNYQALMQQIDSLSFQNAQAQAHA